MKSKKILAMALAVLMLVALALPAPVSAAAQIIDENSGWTWPTVGSTISRNGGFGVYRSSDGKYHQGIDISVVTGTEVYAARSGTVVYAPREPDSSMGYYITIRHGKNADGKYLFSTYMHLSRPLVNVGDPVNAGDVIGLSGNTGLSSGPHLHFHVFRSKYEKPASSSPNRASRAALAANYVDVGQMSIYASTLNINVTSAPTHLKAGSGWGMRGSVTSNYKISRVEAVIKNSAGHPVMSAVETPRSTSMDIRYSRINNDLIFNDLPAGEYRLEITATDTSGATRSWWTGFTVQVPTVSFSMTSYPTRSNPVRKGKCFGLRGTISSNFVITQVRGQIIRRSDGASVDKTWDSPNANSLNVRYANLNKYLDFNLLKPGEYTLKITVYLDCGNTFTWSQNFRVTYF